MIKILFSYSGVVNGTNIDDNATLFADPSTGDFNAVASFDSFPGDFHPGVLSNSLLSISWSNGGKAASGTKNIFDLTNGEYTSIREVEVLNSSGQLVGNITINGYFEKIEDDLYSAEVTITGSYSGPLDIIFPTGYQLPLTPVSNYKLEGSFQNTIQTDGGQTLTTENNHTYIFNNGTTSDLEAVIFELTFDTDESYWLPDDKILNLEGNSTINPQ